MSEHQPEVDWDETVKKVYAHCLYPFSCFWQSQRYDTEAEAKAAADAHRTTVEALADAS